MIDAPIGLAFAAGLVATVNPCGFAMLPAYLSYFMGLDGAGADAADVPQAAAVEEVVRAEHAGPEVVGVLRADDGPAAVRADVAERDIGAGEWVAMRARWAAAHA